MAVRACEFVAVPLLFVGFGSNASEVASAKFVNVPPSSANAVTVKFVFVFGASLNADHVTKLLTTDRFVGVALTNVKPTGNWSLTKTFVAMAVPRFVTVME